MIIIRTANASQQVFWVLHSDTFSSVLDIARGFIDWFIAGFGPANAFTYTYALGVIDCPFRYQQILEIVRAYDTQTKKWKQHERSKCWVVHSDNWFLADFVPPNVYRRSGTLAVHVEHWWALRHLRHFLKIVYSCFSCFSWLNVMRVELLV
jgi:hypothetical protein